MEVEQQGDYDSDYDIDGDEKSMGGLDEEERDEPELVPVVCRARRGTLDLSRMTVTCHCDECKEGNEMSPSGFEKHCGAGSSRNWKNSLRHSFEDISMKSWLQHHGHMPAPKAPEEKREEVKVKKATTKKARSDPSIMDFFQVKKKGQETVMERKISSDYEVNMMNPNSTVKASVLGEREIIELDNEEPVAAGKLIEEVDIACRGKRGTLCLKTWMVSCQCEECGEGGMLMKPTAFENHAGAGSQKKWKASCRTVDLGEGSMTIERFFASHGIISPGSQKSKDGCGPQSKSKPKSSRYRWSAVNVIRLVRALQSSDIAGCREHAEVLLDLVRAYKPETLMLEPAPLSSPEDLKVDPKPRAEDTEASGYDTELKWGGVGKRSQRRPRKYGPPPPPSPSPLNPSRTGLPGSSHPATTGVNLASTLAAAIMSAALNRSQAMSSGLMVPTLPTPTSFPRGNLPTLEWLPRLFQGLQDSQALIPLLLMPPDSSLLPLPSVAYDVLGPNPFETDEDIDFMITGKLGSMSSMDISSFLEQFVVGLDLKARSDVHLVWQSERAKEQDAETGRSKLPSLPGPSGLSERATGRRRARILKDGALSMIVFGYDERLVWAKRIGSFIRSMRAVLGDRSLQTRWGGSVLDSVVGTFLTQNGEKIVISIISFYRVTPG